jgi:hypothetical protein
MKKESPWPLLVILFLISLILAAWLFREDLGAQEGGREITEDMKKLCPDLAEAEGRKKEQICALFFDLEADRMGEKKQDTRVRELFDLTKAGDGVLLKTYLFEEKQPRCMHGLKVVFTTHGARGVVWLLNRYEKASALKKARIIEVLHWLDHREVCGFLAGRLGDTQKVEDWHAAQQAPPGYVAKRVCDYAFSMLAYKISGAGGLKLPKEVGKPRIHPFVPLKERDARIAALKTWVADPKNKAYQAFLSKRSSLVEELEGKEAEDAKELLKRLGL